MPTILAIDLGTKTGWAFYHNRGKSTLITSGTVNFVNDRYQGGGMRYLKFERWLKEFLTHHCGTIDEIYFEEVRRHAATHDAHAYGGFMATLTSWCEDMGIPYEGVPVQTIKKFITGKGNANKQAVIDAVKDLGYNPADDNEADAIALLLHVTSK